MEKFFKDIDALPKHYKTKDLDTLINKYLKEETDVSGLKNYLLEHQEFHRIYFKINLKRLQTIEEQFAFIERHFCFLNDWWHIDQLLSFLKPFPLDFAIKKASIYLHNPNTFARRFAYVIFIPRLVKQEEAFNQIVKLLCDDNEYYVVMAEAWLISFLAIYHPQKTYAYLKSCKLSYKICGKAIQKICDSYMVSIEWKERFKSLRPILKK